MTAAAPPTTGPIEVRLATTPLERDAVFQLRHRVLGSSGMGVGRGLSSSNGRLLEAADCGAEIFAAFGEDGTAYAALRRQPLLSLLKIHECYGPLLKVAQRLGSDPGRVSASSRFISDPATGGANLALRVFATMLRHSTAAGITHDLCWADDDRLAGRLSLGYENVRTRILDAAGIPMQVLSLEVGPRVARSGSIQRLIRRVVKAA